jgi:hypothetical protein
MIAYSESRTGADLTTIKAAHAELNKQTNGGKTNSPVSSAVLDAQLRCARGSPKSLLS